MYLPLEGNLDGLAALIFLLFFIGFGVPIILAIIGGAFWFQQKRKTAKTLFIISVVYLLISLGVCGSMLY